MQDNQKNKDLISSAGGVDFTRYLHLIKRKKWLILGIFSIVFVVWMVLAAKFAPRQTYNTNALLQLEDRRALSALDTRGRPENEGKLGLIMSRNFLGKVVDKLSLAVKFNKVDRSSVVDSVSLEDEYLAGSYSLIKKQENIKLFYTNPEKTIEGKQVLDMTYPQNHTIEYGGFKLVFKENYLDLHNEVDFKLVTKEKAVESLRLSLQPSFRNRNRTLLSVSIKGTDRYFIKDVVNTLVDEFVLKNLDVKKYHTREILDILSEQLKTAQQELDKAVEELKVFRERNPWVGLTADATGIVTGISTHEAEKASIENRRNEIDMLLTRYNSSSDDTKYPILNEILSFLTAQGAATVSALSSEFGTLTTERSRLLGAYALEHPVIAENKRKLDELEKKVLLTANNQKAQYDNQIRQVQSKINESSYKIRTLPAKELELAELQRRRSVADQIFSALLIRHNQAKIADAVEVGDIIILDPAVVPTPGSRMKDYLKYALIGIILGLGFGVGYVIVGDFLDKTVRTSEELEKILPIRVLAKIPVIGREKELSIEDIEAGARIDPKLVTADYSPTPVGEAYRSLRTQLLFSDNKKKAKSIFITSLNPNEGKSLNAGNIAITLAQQKLPTLLVDGDLRRGVIHNTFVCKKKPGLSDFLYSSADITDENIRKIIQQTHIPNLYLLSSGMPIPNPSEILGGQRGKDVIEFLAKRFGFVIIDTPPITITSDAIIISQYVDTGLFVVRAGKSNVEQIKKKILEYKDFSNKLSGIILNYAKFDIEKDTHRYSYYNY